MSRFNRQLAAPAPNAYTAQSGDGFTRTAKDELFLLAIANFVGQSTFYEDAGTRDARQVQLVHEVTHDDPTWVAEFARWLRSGANMRTVALVVAAEYVAAGGPNGRRVVESVLHRPDEPAELIGYWHQTHGRNLPQPIKRGIADALARLYTERNVLRYDGSGKAYRFADVIRMTHPRPVGPWQDALFGHLSALRKTDEVVVPSELPTLTADAQLRSIDPDARRSHLHDAIAAGWPWERVAGWVPGGMDAVAWEAVIPNMGVMALLRNLRNFDDAGVDGPAAAMAAAKLADAAEIRKARVFPLRFLSAAKAVSSVRWLPALEAGVNQALANVPALPGRTLILLDVSGSMQDYVSTRRTDGGRRGFPVEQPLRYEAAGLFALALGQRASSADLIAFSTRPTHKIDVGSFDSILRAAQDMRHIVGGGTDTLGSLAATYDGHDRVVILTDEQTGARGLHDSVAHIRCPVLTWNLAGYGIGHTPRFGNWQTFGGLTDAAFSTVGLLDRHSRGGWPWEDRGQAQEAA